MEMAKPYMSCQGYDGKMKMAKPYDGKMDVAKPYTCYMGYDGKMEMSKLYMRYQGYDINKEMSKGGVVGVRGWGGGGSRGTLG